MLVYRIGKTKHAADLSGEGAKINGGRWNHKTVPCVYTSETRALSLLEYTVNVNIENIPRALSVTTIEIADEEILIIHEKDLPGNWRSVPVSSSTQDFGTLLLKTSKKPVIKIPSSIIAEEFNFILNPLQPRIGFRIVEIKDLVYDVRIKTV